MKKLFAFALLGICLMTTVHAQTVDSSLVCYLPFENSTEDYSVFNNDAAVFGNPEYVDAVSGKGLKFDGSDFLTILGTPSFHQISEAYTIAAWVKIDEVLNFYTPIVTKGNTLDMNTPIAIVYRSPETTPYIRIQGAASSFQTMNLENAPQACPVGEWVFITWTFQNGKVSIYRNAELWAEQQFGFVNLNTNSLPMDIGRDVPGFNIEWFKGTMDEFCMFNRKLSETEIRELYTKKLTSVQEQVPQPAESYTLKLFPNPNPGQFYLETDLPGQKRMYMYAANGTLVLQNTFDQPQMSVQKVLPSGTYTVFVIAETGAYISGRVVISN